MLALNLIFAVSNYVMPDNLGEDIHLRPKKSIQARKKQAPPPLIPVGEPSTSTARPAAAHDQVGAERGQDEDVLDGENHPVSGKETARHEKTALTTQNVSESTAVRDQRGSTPATNSRTAEQLSELMNSQGNEITTELLNEYRDKAEEARREMAIQKATMSQFQLCCYTLAWWPRDYGLSQRQAVLVMPGLSPPRILPPLFI